MVEDLKQMDLDYVLHTYARDYTHFLKGSGARLFDEGGRDYIDFGAKDRNDRYFSYIHEDHLQFYRTR